MNNFSKEELYSKSFDEILRQVTINNPNKKKRKKLKLTLPFIKLCSKYFFTLNKTIASSQRIKTRDEKRSRKSKKYRIHQQKH